MSAETPKETYIGDGLYASFDGEHFKLRAKQYARFELATPEETIAHRDGQHEFPLVKP